MSLCVVQCLEEELKLVRRSWVLKANDKALQLLGRSQGDHGAVEIHPRAQFLKSIKLCNEAAVGII